MSNALAEMYAEHHDFIEHVYRQCHLWRTQTPSQEPQQLAKTAHLEKLTQRLESLTDQILYGMDCLQKRQSVSWMIQM